MVRALKERSQIKERLIRTRVSLVSAYSHKQGIVIAAEQFESKKGSELKVVQTMLEALNLEGVVFTMDALHCKKKY